MKRKIHMVLGIIAGVILLVLIIGYIYYRPNKGLVLNFIKENPDKTAIKLIRNDSILADKNSDRIMPLASTVKIIIAIEYAEQASSGKINPDELISLETLDKLYVPKTDGGAHSKWKKSNPEKINTGKISIREIAKGMIHFSSNANTDWLNQRLGLENVNKRLGILGIKKHSEIYYIVSAMFVGKEAFPGLKGDKLKENLLKLPMEEYRNITLSIHKKLLSDTSYKYDLGDLGLKIQKIWSDRLPGSTTSEYASLMQKINSKKYFTPQVQQYLDETMEWMMDKPKNKEWLKHAGMKGGSTAFVLTKALYATDKDGNTTELAYFLNNLSIWENSRLMASMNEFEKNILINEEFRLKVIEALGN